MGKRYMVDRFPVRDIPVIDSPVKFKGIQPFEEGLLIVFPALTDAGEDFLNEHLPPWSIVGVDQAAPESCSIVLYGSLLSPDGDEGAGVAPVVRLLFRGPAPRGPRASP